MKPSLKFCLEMLANTHRLNETGPICIFNIYIFLKKGFLVLRINFLSCPGASGLAFVGQLHSDVGQGGVVRRE